MRQLMVSERDAGQRLDKFLGKYLDKAPKSFIYKMLRKKNITLNGKKADGSEKLIKADEIKLFLAEETIEKFVDNGKKAAAQKKAAGLYQEKVTLDILYEDENVLIINKPAGMLSQKAQKDDISLIEHLTAYLLESGQLTEEELKTFHPGICNRLDRNTSGIIIAGKTLLGLQTMSELLRTRNVDKYYQCIVKGKVEKKQLIEGYLYKNHNHNKVVVSDTKVEHSEAIRTEYEPLIVREEYTLLKVKLLTGKSHQIRAHLQSIGHSVIGDGKYGDVPTNRKLRKVYKLKHHLLHSWQLCFPKLEAPFEALSEKIIEAPLPDYFKEIKENLL